MNILKICTFFCCFITSLIGMTHEAYHDDKETYEIKAQGNTLIIKNQEKIKERIFNKKITAAVQVQSLPYALVGFEDGTIVRCSLHNKKSNMQLPSSHTSAITALYGDDENFFSADISGTTCLWYTIWSHRIYSREISIKLPVVCCKGTRDFLALQHRESAISYQKISLFNRATHMIQELPQRGTLLAFLDKPSKNTLFIGQDHRVVALISAQAGTILDKIYCAADTQNEHSST